MEVHKTVHEAMTKTTPKEKKCKKATWLSEEGLQIANERRQVKGKGERERYTQLNAEFQRQQEKKVFLSKQCNGMEENNRIGKTRDYLKKIGDIKGTFRARIGTIKDRNGKDLTEAEDIKKRF